MPIAQANLAARHLGDLFPQRLALGQEAQAIIENHSGLVDAHREHQDHPLLAAAELVLHEECEINGKCPCHFRFAAFPPDQSPKLANAPSRWRSITGNRSENPSLLIIER
jgi:hypothetical protein